ncbi:MAG: pyridoxal-phosphate dependent enzyme [Pseudonocardiaceae bacterium]|nr:pyridoxal-phosphate dependent enzyme [Pseudonocardiaceae bacterium]
MDIAAQVDMTVPPPPARPRVPLPQVPWPRFPLAVLPTPLVRAHRLEAALRCGPLLLKRDDLAGFAAAGNKTRPLEYLLGAALAEGCDVLVTGGGPGSNFCPAAALAARAAGLDCELVVWGDITAAPNIALAAAAGARLHRTGDDRRDAVDAAVEDRAAALASQGRRPYPVPRGGSTAVGAAGFAVAAAELVAQLDGPPAFVALAVGSGGSCAGLLAGLAVTGQEWPVLGISVSRPPAEISSRIAELAQQCASALGAAAPRLDLLEIVDGRGPGFGVAAEADRDRGRLALHTEGLLLDDTYGAKAFAATADRLPRRESRPVVYWHTGGLIPAVAALDSATRGAA